MKGKKTTKKTIVYTDEDGIHRSAINSDRARKNEFPGDVAEIVQGGFRKTFALNGFATCKMMNELTFWYVFDRKEIE